MPSSIRKWWGSK